jgi:hypothetical protein
MAGIERMRGIQPILLTPLHSSQFRQVLLLLMGGEKGQSFSENCGPNIIPEFPSCLIKILISREIDSSRLKGTQIST